MKRIVYLDRASIPERFEIRKPSIEHQWVDHASTSYSELLERCRDADVLVSNKVKIGEAVLKACPTVKHIAVSATGYNVIDIEACQRHGVSVSNIPSYAATTVAEHVITSALCLRRELIHYRANVIDGDWQRSPTFCSFGKPINDISNATLGVVGLGEIGLETAKKAHALGMKVIYSSRSNKNCSFAKRVGFKYLLRHSDIISIHCSLNSDTENLIAATELAAMKGTAILINTARGGIVNEGDVVDAINSNVIGAISFDTLIEEPPRPDSPLLSIANKENVIITPHTGWASEQAMQSLSNILSDNIEGFLLGSPINIVS